MRISLVICIISFSLLLHSCAGPFGKKIIPADTTNRIYSLHTFKSVLYTQYEKWKNVRYREGGMSKNGVDCSAFVMLTFHKAFNYNLPRSTDEQALTGREVDRHELLAGDLVFFDTGLFTSHVGIFLEKGLFLHVSTSAGVTLSNLSDEYWTESYSSARRHNIVL